jgi:hypothetical protein
MMAQEFAGSLDPDGLDLVTKAESLCCQFGHGALDPLHLAMAMFDDEGTWLLERFGEPGVTRADLQRDLAGRVLRQPDRSEAAVRHVIALATAQARSMQRRRANQFDLLYAVWLAPGPHQRSLVASRRRALPVLRLHGDASRPLDRYRILMGATRSIIGRNVNRLFTRIERSKLRPLLWLIRSLLRVFLFLLELAIKPALWILTAPGIFVREGNRAIIAPFFGTSRHSREFLRTLGSEVSFEPLPHPLGHVGVLLLPSFITFIVGVLWLIPPVLRRDLLGVPLLPVLTQHVANIPATGDDLVLAQLTGGARFGLWMALGCLFAAMPTYEQFRQVRWELGISGSLSRLVALCLWPLQVFSSIARPIDRLLAMMRFPAVVGTGLAGVLLGLFVATRIAHAFF